LSFHRDSYLPLLSPYYNDSIFTQVFCQKRHLLDYQLGKTTLIVLNVASDLEYFVFDEAKAHAFPLPYKWLYLNKAMIYIECKDVPKYNVFKDFSEVEKITGIKPFLSKENLEARKPPSYYLQ
jgi:hypothetical protein